MFNILGNVRMKNYQETSQQIIDFVKESDFSNIINVDKIDFELDDKGRIVVKDYEVLQLPQDETHSNIEDKEVYELLSALTASAIHLFGYEANLNFLNVSNVKDFSLFFSNSHVVRGIHKQQEFYIYLMNFNGFIDEWDFSNAISLFGLFYFSQFNQHDLQLTLPNIKDLSSVFYKSLFNKNFSIKGTMPFLEKAKRFINHDYPIGDIEMDLSQSNNLINISMMFNNKSMSVRHIQNVKFKSNIVKNKDLNVLRFINNQILFSNTPPNSLNSLKKFLQSFNLEDVSKILFVSGNIDYNFILFALKSSNFNRTQIFIDFLNLSPRFNSEYSKELLYKITEKIFAENLDLVKSEILDVNNKTFIEKFKTILIKQNLYPCDFNENSDKALLV